MTAEIRGRGKTWKVFYPDEAAIASDFLVFDRDGVQVGVIQAGGQGRGMVEAHFVGTKDEATAYARYLGATEVVVKTLATRGQALAKARAVAKQQRAAA
jgi:hypothetical protein